MRVVIIGSNGFIGTNLLRLLWERDVETVCCDYRKPVQKLAGVSYCVIAPEDVESYRNLLKPGDCVVILKWKGVPATSYAEGKESAEHNVIGTMLLLDICRECRVGKIIFASSGGAVYGNVTELPIKESIQPRPISLYGVQKLMVEDYVQYVAVKSGIASIILRISNPYGPFQVPFNGQGIIATYLAANLLDREVEVWGDGNSLRDYIYIEDAAECIYQCAAGHVEDGIYNVGSGRGTSIFEICDVIEVVTGKEMKKILKPASDIQVEDNVLDCTRIKRQVSWDCKLGLREGIEKMQSSWNGRDFSHGYL